MALKFTNTSEAGSTPNVLVYGPSGCGKTTLCATLEDPVIVTSEKGNLSIDNHDIPVIEISTLDDGYEAYEKVKGSRFKEVCLDSGTDVAETALVHLRKKYKDGRVYWDKLNAGMSDLMRKFRDLDKCTYIICEMEESENSAGIVMARPAMPGRTLLRKMPHFFDVVLKMEMVRQEQGNPEPILHTAASPNWYAKDRSRRLNPTEPADLGLIFRKLAESSKPKKKKKKKEA